MAWERVRPLHSDAVEEQHAVKVLQEVLSLLVPIAISQPLWPYEATSNISTALISWYAWNMPAFP